LLIGAQDAILPDVRLIALDGVLAVNLFAADFPSFGYDRSLPLESLDPHDHEIFVLNGTRLAFVNFAVTPSVRLCCRSGPEARRELLRPA
jgi:hypothetical protein